MYLKQSNSNFSLNIKGKLMELEHPKVMGILNITPDSFSDGGQNMTKENALISISKMIDEGLDILDIGAMSSRPYSHQISIEDEIARVKSVLPYISEKYPHLPISIDTYRSEVAEYAIKNGASIINDITAGMYDDKILDIAIKYKTPFIAMHMKGMPLTMQDSPQYDNIIKEIFNFLSERITRFKEKNILDVVLDVGFGFGKTIEDNYSLLKNLSYFGELNTPLLVGISRKGMLYKPLDISPQETLIGSSALHFEALRQGAKILRVHDVKAAKQVVTLFELYQKSL